MANQRIESAIDALAQDKGIKPKAAKTKKTVHISEDLINDIEYYQKALGYKTFSGALEAILENFFNDLVKHKEGVNS